MSAPSEDKHAEAGHGPQPVVQSKQDDQTDESSAGDALIASSSFTTHPSIEHPHGHSHGPSPAEHHGEVDTHQYFEYDGNNHNQGEQPKKDLRKRDFGASSLEAGHGPVIHPTGPRLEKRDFGASSLEAGHGPVIHPTGQRLEKRSVQEPMMGAMQVSSRTGGALHVGEGEKVEKGN